jgi:hypothetical protein
VYATSQGAPQTIMVDHIPLSVVGDGTDDATALVSAWEEAITLRGPTVVNLGHNLWIYRGKLEGRPGGHISGACADLVAYAAKTGETQTIDFNGVAVTSDGTEAPEDLLAKWQNEMDRKAEEYRNDPQRVVEAAERGQKARLQGTQLGSEGDAANEEGGVLNPALVSMGY